MRAGREISIGPNHVHLRHRRCDAKMTPAQIAEAQKLAREWKPTK
jgi:hypothetical protein